jgi:hypothetical protein
MSSVTRCGRRSGGRPSAVAPHLPIRHRRLAGQHLPRRVLSLRSVVWAGTSSAVAGAPASSHASCIRSSPRRPDTRSFGPISRRQTGLRRRSVGTAGTVTFPRYWNVSRCWIVSLRLAPQSMSRRLPQFFLTWRSTLTSPISFARYAGDVVARRMRILGTAQLIRTGILRGHVPHRGRASGFGRIGSSGGGSEPIRPPPHQGP